MKIRLTLVSAVLLAFIAIYAQSRQKLFYWFDTSPVESVILESPETELEIDASSLSSGLHSVTMMVEGENGLSSPRTKFFVRIFNPGFESGIKALIMIDGKEQEAVAAGSDGRSVSYIFDAKELKVGLHTLTTAVVSRTGAMTNLESTFFMRVPMDSEIANSKLYYFVDRDINNIRCADMTGTSAVYSLNLDFSGLTSGLHSVTSYIANPLGFTSSPVTSYFVKIPQGGEGIARYDYWVDDEDKTTVILPDRQMPFRLTEMIEFPEIPFRSSNFEIRMENEGIGVYGRHTFNFMCFDADYRTASSVHEYVESRIRKEVGDITELKEKSGNISTGEIAENDIRWYAVNMEVGDSLVLNTSGVSGIDVFDPNGEKCYRATGRGSVVKEGFHAFEDGRYLIAIHDLSSPGSSTVLHYNHIDKFDIIETGPKSTAEADMFVLNITGNGIFNLKSAKLVGGGKEYESSRIVATDRGHGYCIFDLTGAALTRYDLVAEFEDDKEEAEITVTGALSVVTSSPGEIRVSAARSVFGTTLNDVLIKVTNTGNVPYWGIPFNIAAEADGTHSIKMNFKDFSPNMPGDDINDWTMYMTDNLLGTGRRGGYLPMMIPYLGPNETKEYTIVYQMPLTVHIPTYTWTGRPWSEEFKEIIAELEEGRYPEIKNLNYLSASTFNLAINYYNYLESQSEISEESDRTEVRRRYVDMSGINNATDLAGHAGQAAGYNMSGYNNAASAARTAVGIGNTLGGIINGARLSNLDATLAAAGIDLSSGEYSDLANYRNSLQQSLPDPSRIASDTWGPGAGLLVGGMLGCNSGCAETASPMPTAADIVQYTPCDPNDIIGYQDPSGGRFVGLDVTTIPYTIEFENDPELANAPAHVIKVTDKLDPKVFDLTTFRMREIKIGKKSLMLNDSTDFVTTIDMRPEINAVAEVSFRLDKNSGDAEWTVRSLDLLTMDPATEMIQGVLPVNTAGEGCGEIMFDIDLRKDLASEVRFSNKATIIFDRNDPIDTPEWDNVTDYDRPVALVTEVENEGDLYKFNIESSDKGAGIHSYNLWYLAEGSTEWVLLKGAIPEGEISYESESPLAGSFCVVATDGAGNVQHETPMSLLLGDADGDGMVDANDVVVIQNYYTDHTTQIRRIEADINIDYTIDSQDAVMAALKFLHNDPSHNSRIRKYTHKK